MIKNINMSVVRRPPQYTALACLVLIGMPVFWLNVWILQKGPLIKLIQSEKAWWLVVEAAWTLLTLHWLLKAKRRGLWSVIVLSATLLLGNAYFLVATKNYALAFYA